MAVFEVLSKCTVWIDQGLKLRDYDATPTILTYALISQDEQKAMVYSHDAAGRVSTLNLALPEGAGAAIQIPLLGVTLPFSALYEGTDLAPEPA